MSLHVRNIKKTYTGIATPILDGVSFDVGAGALVAVVGKSGAGKTTLLRCLSGLEPFDAGSVEGEGFVSSPSSWMSLRGRVGLVFQAAELFPHLTALQNCMLAPVLVKHASRSDAEAGAMELLVQLELGDKAFCMPEELSGGQKQRVAIVRALMMQPRVLLYDEPTSALDPGMKREVAKTLARVAERTSMAQVVVTHDIALLEEISARRLHLQDGVLVESSSAG